MPIDKQLFKSILGSFASGVTVITTVGDDGKPYGLTATAFSSVSLEPPLILVCVDKRAESHAHLLAAKRFTVALLAAGQEELSNRFAKSGVDKFTGIDTTFGAVGVPYPRDGVAHMDCHTAQVVDAGDHTIFIGEVAAGASREGDPLLYFRGRYRGLS